MGAQRDSFSPSPASFVVFGAALAISLLSGCERNLHRSETTMRFDGTIERAVYQPENQTPKEIAESPVWTKAFLTSKRERDDWGEFSILDLKAEEVEKERHFAAWGEFPLAAKIPEHFTREINQGEFRGGLTAAGTRKDLLLVAVMEWEETLTDIVSLDDFAAARKELADWQIGLLDDVLRQSLGPDADVSRLLGWFQSEGRLWFQELSDAYLDVALRRLPSRSSAFEEKAKAICLKRGLDLDRKDAIYYFAANLVRDKLKLKDGRKLDEADIRDLLGAFGLEQENQPSTPAERNRFKTALAEIGERKHGGDAKRSMRMLSLATRMIGVYGLFGDLEQFDSFVRLPGLIIETNGRLISESEAAWSFSAADAYPFGYRMHARSIARNDEACKPLFAGKAALVTRRQLMAYVDAVESDDALLPVLKRCVAAGNLQPLTEHRQRVEQGEDEDAKKTTRQLVRALDL